MSYEYKGYEIPILTDEQKKKNGIVIAIQKLLDEYNIELIESSKQLIDFVGSEHLELIEIWLSLKTFNKENQGKYNKATLQINDYGFRIDPQ